MKVLFILGTGHCGSTLLDLMLNSHPNIVGVGEVGNEPLKSKCTCGNKPNQCNFWNKVLQQESRLLSNLKIYQNKPDFLFNKKNFIYPDSEKVFNKKDYIRKNEKLFSTIYDNTDVELIVDSTKNVHRVDCLLDSEKIDPIILHLVRDGRGVFWSYYKKYQNPPSHIRLWVGKNLQIEILKYRSNIDNIFVKYEDLVNNTKQTIQDILVELNMNYKECMLDFRKGNHHQLGGNRMRFGDKEEIEEDLEWQRKMPKRYRLLFNIFGGWLNFYYRNK